MSGNKNHKLPIYNVLLVRLAEKEAENENCLSTKFVNRGIMVGKL